MKISTADMRKGRLMSDLISTQEAVVKIVDTAIQKILSGEQKLTKEYEQSVIDAVDVILNTAQPKIIRCKDCLHYYTGFPYDRCLITDKYAEENDFCSWAERRTDED